MYRLKNDKRTIQSANWTYEAFSRLLNKKSFEEIKIKEIAEEAKIGRTTFYRIFDKKIDILLYELDRHFNEIIILLNKEVITDRLKALKIFLDYWNNNSLIIEQLLDIKKVYLLYESINKHLTYFLVDTSIFNDNELRYLSTTRNVVLMSILVEWIKSEKKSLQMSS